MSSSGAHRSFSVPVGKRHDRVVAAYGTSARRLETSELMRVRLVTHAANDGAREPRNPATQDAYGQYISRTAARNAGSLNPGTAAAISAV
jgi:hypothetical protein